MNSRRRITAALIGLLALVIGVWLAQHALSDQPDRDQPAVVDAP